MGRIDWLYWLAGGGGGGGGNSRPSSTKREKMPREIKESGCMCAVFHLFHFHRNYSNTHPNIYPFLQHEATPPPSTTGLEAPRNSLELLSNVTASIDEASTPLKQQNNNSNFPVGIIKKIKTSHERKSSNASRIDEISSNCNSPSVVARLMGLESTSPSISIPHKSRKDTCLLQKTFFDVDPLSARSLPETPRTSASSRKSDVERHRLSLQISKEKELFSLSDGRRGRLSDNRRLFGVDITNKNPSTADQNLSLLNPGKRNHKYGDENNKNIKTRSSRISSSYDINHQEQRKKLVVSKNLPARAAVDNRRRREDGFVRSRERNNKVDLAENKTKRRPLSCPTHTTQTKLPQKKSQVSDSLSSESNTQLSSKPTVSPCITNGGATALHGGVSPEQRNYIHVILKHTGLINQVNPLVKWHSPSQPIDPRLFHHLEFKVAAAAAAAVDGCNTVLSRRCDRKLIFQLVNELLAEIFTHSFRLSRRDFPVGGDGGLTAVEELCQKIDGFPAAKCVVLEDIDSLIERDLCKSQLNGFKGEEEDMVCEIEGGIMEELVREAVAVMGGDAAEERTGIGHVGL